jgi:hypothetical protein
MKILDTPQWDGLTSAEKAMVNNIHGNDTGDGWTIALSPGAAKVAQSLVDKGLITVTPGERKFILALRESGWSLPGRAPASKS